LVLRDLALQAGQNTVRLSVSNEDGPCLRPATLTITYVAPPKPPAPPLVELIDPRTDTVVTTAKRAVRFRVTSPAPLRAVEVVRDTVPPLHIPVGLPKNPGPRGFDEFAIEVPLEPGANPVTIKAVNEGGEGPPAQVTVSRTEEPVRVVIDGIKPLGPGQALIEPTKLPEGRLEFPALKAGRVKLFGHVLLDQGDAPAGKGHAPPEVEITVNGFKQAPADLLPATPGQRDRPFEATLLLNREGDNAILLEVPALKQDGQRRRELTVACSQPVKKLRPHLLIVGVEDQPPDDLQERVLKALGARPVGTDRFRKENFEEGQVVTLTGSRANSGRIFANLVRMKKTIAALNKPGEASDVLVVYFEGAEKIQGGARDHPEVRVGHFLLTGLSSRDSDPLHDAVGLSDLREYLEETLGAEVLFLDMKEVGQPATAQDGVRTWPDEQHVGVFRYSWHGAVGRPADAALLANLQGAISSSQPVTLGQLKSLLDITRNYGESLSLDSYVPRPLGGFRLSEPDPTRGR
jgi:hypothetical protein